MCRKLQFHCWDLSSGAFHKVADAPPVHLILTTQGVQQRRQRAAMMYMQADVCRELNEGAAAPTFAHGVLTQSLVSYGRCAFLHMQYV